MKNEEEIKNSVFLSIGEHAFQFIGAKCRNKNKRKKYQCSLVNVSVLDYVR